MNRYFCLSMMLVLPFCNKAMVADCSSEESDVVWISPLCAVSSTTLEFTFSQEAIMRLQLSKSELQRMKLRQLKKDGTSTSKRKGLKPRVSEDMVSLFTTDNVKIMMFKKYVDESTLFKQLMRTVEGKGLCVQTYMTHKEFENIKDYLRGAAQITSLQNRCRTADSDTKRSEWKSHLEKEVDRQYAFHASCAQEECQHVKPFDLCDHVVMRHGYWRYALKVATQLGITNLRQILLKIGQDRTLLQPASAPEIIAQKKAVFYNSLI